MLDRHAFDEATHAVQDITGDYTIDASHTRIGFSARHAMVTTVRGQFDEFEGTAHIDTAEPGQLQRHGQHPGRQRHHRQRPTATATSSSADFFDVETYPEIRFVSTDVDARRRPRGPSPAT